MNTAASAPPTSSAPPGASLQEVLGRLGKTPQDHKYGHGHALVLAGGSGQGGAARLAARGALRIGAGLVTVGCPPAAIAEHAAQLNAIMLTPIDSGDELTAQLDDPRINALCLGPAMGQGPRTDALVQAALTARRATVLDADALSFYHDQPEALFARTHDRCVLTPHAGEFARLFPDHATTLTREQLHAGGAEKLAVTVRAAQRAGCVVVLKGAATTIADPAGRTARHDRPAPWLATAGTGDVLAGIVTGLMARGLDAFDAARAAVWLHAEAARRFGPGLIAEDIPEALPRVLKALGH